MEPTRTAFQKTQYSASKSSQTGSRRLPDEYIYKVTEATDIVTLIGEYVPLKKAGFEYIGCCPFHDEKSPSFSVNGAKGVYVCRGCGAKGNAVQFLKEHTGMSFNEALDTLAQRASMPRPNEVRAAQSPENSAIANEYQQIQSLVERAKILYQDALKKNPKAMEYLESRGINADDIRDFGIGYSPGGGNFLLENMKDVSPSLMVKAGLLSYKEEENQYRDVMSYRVIFPINNSSGKTIAFGGRALHPDAQRKYLNTPETMLFKKGSELYGMYEASRSISKEKTAIVTEGYLDTVIPAGYGIKNTVSAMGATIQTATIEKLFRSADHIIYCFDGDKAGLNAASKALEQSISLVNDKRKISFAFLPNGYDPDEYVLEHGAEKFRELLASAKPLSKFLINDIGARHNLKDIEGCAAFAAEAMGLINKMKPCFMKDVLASSVKQIVGLDSLPEQAQSSSTNMFDRVALQAVKPSNSAPPMNIFGRRGGQAPGQAKLDNPAEPPTLSMRIIGMLMNDAEAAAQFNPKWADYDKRAKPGEVECIQHIISIASDEKNSFNNQSQLLEICKNTPHEDILKKAQHLGDKTVVNDPIEELSKLAMYLVKCKQQEMKRQAKISGPG